MRYILVDITDRTQFYPFSLTRSLADIRVGIFSLKERWEAYLKEEAGVFTVSYLQSLYEYSDFLHTNDPLFFINITCIPTPELITQIQSIPNGGKLMDTNGKWIASHSKERNIQKVLLPELAPIIYDKVQFILNALHLLQIHGQCIQKDVELIKTQRLSQPADLSNRTINDANIFIEEGAIVLCSNLNASNGPIYIGKEAVIMEGVSIRGPFALGYKGVVKMNSSIYGATTIGPYCLAGGEIKNSILMGYSNKGHEGYLGDSIIGFWCNLGAGTCNSNIKNTASEVQLWNEAKQEWDTVGQKMGMLVGDYSRFAIQSRINTGSYIGVSANIFGKGLLPKMMPNFTWGIVAGYLYEKATEDIDNWKKLKGFRITDAEKKVLKHLHDLQA
jgi:UDP-N-acetylglucosamine diphosphorylase/glucosamine-1-phosphate N-acetyltransferase